MTLSATSRAMAPVSGSGPAGTSRATTAFRNDGWSTTPTGAVTYRRDTPRNRAPGRPASAPTAAARVARRRPGWRRAHVCPHPRHDQSSAGPRLGPMPAVTVLVLAPSVATGGPARRASRRARTALAEWHREAFIAAGADGVVVRRDPPDDTPFGARLRGLVAELAPGGPGGAGSGGDPPGDRRGPARAGRGGEPLPRGTGQPALLGRRDCRRVRGRGAPWACPTSRPTTPCPGGWPRWPAFRCGTWRRDAAWPSTSTARSICCCSRTAAAARAAGCPPRSPGRASRCRSGASAAGRAARSAADPTAELLVAGRTSAADLRWARAADAVPDPCPGRGARPPDGGPRCPAGRTGGRPGHPRRAAGP